MNLMKFISPLWAPIFLTGFLLLLCCSCQISPRIVPRAQPSLTGAGFDITPPGCSAVRPDVVRIGEYLYVHILKLRPGPGSFVLIKLDKNLRTIYVSDIYSGKATPTDARVATDNNDDFFYSFETVYKDRIPGNFLNFARYDVSSDSSRPILKEYQEEVAVSHFAVPPVLPPVGTELMDDPAPFFHRGRYWILTKTFSSPQMYLRSLGEDLTVKEKRRLDLRSLGKVFFSPSVLISVGDQVFLIAGVSNGPQFVRGNFARIMAIPLTSDLNLTGEAPVSLTGEGEWASYVSSTKYRDGRLYVLYNLFTGLGNLQAGGQEHVGMLKIFELPSFGLKKTFVINRGIMLDNRMSMEFLDDHLYVFYNDESQRIKGRKFDSIELR